MYKKIALLISACSLGAAAEEIVLDLNSADAYPAIELNDKGYWTKTYDTSDDYRWMEFGLFKVSHLIHAWGGTDVGDGMSYWDGFTYCTSGDATDYGEYGSSDGWVPEQWGCIAGGGISGVDADGNATVEQGQPYLVGYWGYWIEEKEGGEPACQIRFTDNGVYRAKSIWVCNHPWPYYGNIHGDGFARAFSEEDDKFMLYINGLDAEGNPTGERIEYTLADTRYDDETGEYVANQSDKWHRVDISELGDIGGIYFSMSSTDSDPIYGMNTACYFCIDRLAVESIAPGDEKPARPKELVWTADENSITATWKSDARKFNVYLDNEQVSSVSGTTYVFTGLDPYTEYKIGIRAIDDNDRLSDPVTATARTTDETAPFAPTGLAASNITPNKATLSWTPAVDNVGVKGYDVILNGVKRARNLSRTYWSFVGLEPGTDYTAEVIAIDHAGNRSEAATLQFSTTTTSIGETEAVEAGGTAEVYTLTGRRVINPRRGIYIRNNHKIIIK